VCRIPSIYCPVDFQASHLPANPDWPWKGLGTVFSFTSLVVTTVVATVNTLSHHSHNHYGHREPAARPGTAGIDHRRDRWDTKTILFVVVLILSLQ
jgi:hypothetical protein